MVTLGRNTALHRARQPRRALVTGLLVGGMLLALSGQPSAAGPSGSAPSAAAPVGHAAPPGGHAAARVGHAAAPVGPPASVTPAPAAARSPLALGVNVTAVPGKSRQQVLQELESSLGRTFATYRAYDDWDSPFPEAFDLFLRDSRHQEILSIAARTSAGVARRYADLAAAAPGSALYQDMVGWAGKIRAYRSPIWVTLQHEPEILKSADLGTPAEYVAAFRTIHAIFDAEGVTNARWVFVATALGFIREVSQPYYPGDDVVETVAADGFNAYGCRGAASNWRTFGEVFDGLRIFGQAHPGKPLMVGEFGVVEDPERPGRKAEWITQVRTTLADPAWSQVRMVSYFNRPSPNVDQPFCREQIATSATAFAAFADLATDPLFGAPAINTAAEPTGTLSGRVTGGLGNPIAGAAVRLIDRASRQPLASSTTSPTGDYRLTVANGVYDLRVSAPAGRSFAPANRPALSVSGAAALDVVLVTSPLVTFSGRLQNREGAAGVKHRMMLLNAAGEVESTFTEGTGGFALRVPAGSYRLRIFTVGFKPFPRQDVTAPLTLTASRSAPLVLPLATVIVAVVDRAGRAVPGTSVDLGCPSTRYSPLAGLTLSGDECVGHLWSDALGQAVFSGLPAASLTLSATAPPGSGLGNVTLTPVTISGSRTLTVTLPPA